MNKEQWGLRLKQYFCSIWCINCFQCVNVEDEEEEERHFIVPPQGNLRVTAASRPADIDLKIYKPTSSGVKCMLSPLINTFILSFLTLQWSLHTPCLSSALQPWGAVRQAVRGSQSSFLGLFSCLHHCESSRQSAHPVKLFICQTATISGSVSCGLNGTRSAVHLPINKVLDHDNDLINLLLFFSS